MHVQIEHFRTRRMVAKRLTAVDFDDIRRLHLQPEVMKTLSVDDETLPDEASREELEHDLAHWEQHGFGLWVFRDREDGQFLGRGGLKLYQINDKDVVGLEYAVMVDHWNRGLATEMAQASLAMGFERLSFPEVSCWALPINYASLPRDGKGRFPLPGRSGLRRPAVPILPANRGRMDLETVPAGRLTADRHGRPKRRGWRGSTSRSDG